MGTLATNVLYHFMKWVWLLCVLELKAKKGLQRGRDLGTGQVTKKLDLALPPNYGDPA